MSDTPRTDVENRLRHVRDLIRLGCEGDTPNATIRLLVDELDAERKRADEAEQRHADATGEWKRQKESAQILLGKYEDAKSRVDEAERDAKLAKEQNAQLAELNQGQFLQLEYLRPIFVAAKKLSDETEEYDFADGLGQGALQEYWDALNTALEPKTDAIDEAMRNG